MLKILRAILLITLSVNMVACQQNPQREVCQAIKPQFLKIEKMNDGAWMPADDFGELLIYIKQLEVCAYE